jgi:hypothetical protein
MTTHERAEKFLRDWRSFPGHDPMIEALAAAFDAYTADLRALLSDCRAEFQACADDTAGTPVGDLFARYVRRINDALGEKEQA